MTGSSFEVTGCDPPRPEVAHPVLTDLLRCPHDDGPLACAPDARALRCPGGHSFDLARQGYVNLLGGGASTGTADTPAMVQARVDFLAAGHYRGLAEALATLVAELVPPAGAGGHRVLDLGAGTGYHLARVLDRLPASRGLALDLSKHALRRAARAHPRLGAAVCDAWQPLPVRSGAVDAVLSVFAPRNAAEIARVLRPGGVLVVATPTGRHLARLVQALGLVGVDEHKDARLHTQLGPHLAAGPTRGLEQEVLLSHPDIVAAVAMGPSARHLDAGQVASRVRVLPDPVPVGVSMTLAGYRRAGSGGSGG